MRPSNSTTGSRSTSSTILRRGHSNSARPVRLVRLARFSRPVRPVRPARPDVVRVELIHQQRALQLARQLTQSFELAPLDAPGRSDCRDSTSSTADSPRPVISRRRSSTRTVAPRAVQQDRDRGEQLEDVQQLFVRRVVGKEMAQVDLPQRRDRPGQSHPAPARDTHVLLGVLRLHALRGTADCTSSATAARSSGIPGTGA